MHKFHLTVSSAIPCLSVAFLDFNNKKKANSKMHILKQCTLYALTQQHLGEFIPWASHNVTMPLTIPVQNTKIQAFHWYIYSCFSRPSGFPPGGFYWPSSSHLAKLAGETVPAQFRLNLKGFVWPGLRPHRAVVRSPCLHLLLGVIPRSNCLGKSSERIPAGLV